MDYLQNDPLREFSDDNCNPINAQMRMIEEPASIPGITAEPIFTLYPNPATNQLTIKYQLQTTGVTTIIFYNLLGQPVSHFVATDKTGQIEMNISDWPSGLYTVKLLLNNELKGYEKVAITR